MKKSYKYETGNTFWTHLIFRDIGHCKAVFWLDEYKKPFLFPFNTTTWRHWIKFEPR